MGHLSKIHMLIERGADVKGILIALVCAYLQLFSFATPLHWAMHGGHVEAIEMLLTQNPVQELADEPEVSVKEALKQIIIRSA